MLTPILPMFRYTAGVVGGLSTIAVCAPSEKFMNMGGPLAIGFGAVFAASLGSNLHIQTLHFPILISFCFYV